MLRSLLRTTRPPKLFPLSRPYSTQHQYRAPLLGRHTSVPRPSFLLAECRHPARIFIIHGGPSFHSTPRAQVMPLIPLLASVLKVRGTDVPIVCVDRLYLIGLSGQASTALEIARTAGRIALTFVPFLLFRNRMSRRFLERVDKHGIPAGSEGKWAEKMTIETQNIKKRTTLFRILIFIPILLFWATIVAALERTPLTGRWRLIVLSPEEEDEIAAQLAGPGWYKAVGDILAQEGPVQIVPRSDWRYAWVKDTLRRLEDTIPILQREHELDPEWLERGPEDVPLPPPAEYPLRPRPRASEYLRRFLETVCERTVQPVPHTIPGPPYSLVIVDKPDASNAFSYGFGPDGGGGIVVYSGFLDDILSKEAPEPPTSHVVSSPEETSWWTFLFGGLFSLTPPPPRHPLPSPEQTTELAILLAHELAHLILSHHLETLSSGTVIAPGIISMSADIVRTIIFPITMMFGPFVNDAVAQLGKVGSGEFAKIGEYCTSMKQEVEADVVSARLLAHAGFDARRAVLFWEDRQLTSKTAECSAAKAEKLDTGTDTDTSVSVVRRIMGSGHPVNEVRVEKLKEELVRWENEKQIVLHRLRAEQQSSGAARKTTA